MGTALMPNTHTNAPVGLRLHAPAKVNLSLRVLGKRADGFHEIRSIVTAVALFDDLNVSNAPGPKLRCTCDNADVPTDDRNLVIQAARALATRCGLEMGAKITLRKRVPIGAGLGGGSSDAAAALRGLNQLWEADQTDEELAGIGATIGSDVPLFFALPTALITGRGERVEKVDLRWSGWALLVFGDREVSTSDVYRAWKSGDGQAPDDAEDRILKSSSAHELASALCSDLEPAVYRVCPEMRTLFDRVSPVLDRPVRVSGAGSTLFTFYDDREEAAQAVTALNGMGLSTALVGAGSNTTLNL